MNNYLKNVKLCVYNKLKIKKNYLNLNTLTYLLF